jgi:hypothetical protein
MKRIYSISLLLVLTAISATAQINRPEIIKKKTEPAKTTEPATPANIPVYTLTAVKANIRTGSDNKEYPSVVWAFLSSRSPSGVSFKQENLKNEMKVNSNTEFGLEKQGTGNITLTDIQKTGFQFSIWYFANFQFDAWKIEGITVTLEFRDQQGNLHPTYGQKTISFGNATGFLNGYGETRMICTTDGYFNPLTAQISK